MESNRNWHVKEGGRGQGWRLWLRLFPLRHSLEEARVKHEGGTGQRWRGSGGVDPVRTSFGGQDGMHILYKVLLGIRRFYTLGHLATVSVWASFIPSGYLARLAFAFDRRGASSRNWK